ncbi:MAG: class I SAM-dependent methyltransferase [Sarcina sp.]
MSYLFKYYSKQYDGFMKLFKLDKNENIIEVLGDISKKKILDIGGGTGALAIKLLKRGADVMIVDPEQNMTKIAKQKNNKIEILNEYSNSISLNDNSMDIIIMRDAFHHIIRKKETLEECKRILKQDGKILICEFDRKHIVSKLISIFERVCFEKIEMVTKEELKALGEYYFTEEELISLTAYEFIYLAKNR